ncbi:MAG: DUF2330 domain-containing protein [Fimbriimonadaceae bacterium]
MRCLRSAVAIAICLRLGGAAVACCGVSPAGRPVAFGDQTNIVVWDEVTHTEHFIRNAKFQSDASDFGFIAPSPSRPQLSEASSAAFDLLAALQPVRHSLIEDLVAPGSASGKADAQVTVVQQADVAGYRATTLLSTDAAALAKWMRANGYETTPAVETWTKAYIAKGWYLTAFKVLDKAKVASTGTIRMSFHATQAFNPFYVPSDNIGAGRKATLRLFFVSSGQYRATLGQSEWRSPDWSAPVTKDISSRLASELKIPPSAIPASAQVEAFVDTDFPRAAPDDIYFARAYPDYALDAAGFAVLGAVGVILWRRFSRRGGSVSPLAGAA